MTPILSKFECHVSHPSRTVISKSLSMNGPVIPKKSISHVMVTDNDILLPDNFPRRPKFTCENIQHHRAEETLIYHLESRQGEEIHLKTKNYDTFTAIFHLQ